MFMTADYKLLGLIIITLVIAGTGCSNPNSQAQLNPETGTHAANWYIDHRAAFLANQAQCAECHGADLHGGISNVSCFSTSFNGMSCHANGPSGHPAGWADPTLHGVSAKAVPNAATMSGFSTCQACHGSDFSGGTANIGCASCHGGSAPHPISWITGTYTHTNADTGNASVCALCHTNGQNSPIAPPSPPAPAGTLPGCFNNTLCHATPACGSCHGIPPDGTAFPNTAGQHAVHAGLGSYINCDTCHTGAGAGTANHQNGIADVSIAAAYNAKSGVAGYNASGLTCSNVSCHGGQPTPNWLTGTIDVNTQCTLCHIYGTTQYNSFNSGHHDLHVNQQHIGCTQCHDTVKLAVNHFTTLNTQAMEGPASATLLNSLNYNATTRSCTPACHGQQTW